MSFSDGYGATPLNIREFEEAASALLQSFDDAQLAILAIQTTARDPGSGLQTPARELLAMLFDRTTPLEVDDSPSADRASVVLRVSRRIDDSVGHVRDELVTLRSPSTRTRWVASAVWAACAVGVGASIALQAWWVAVVLTVMRIGGSIVIGTSDFPADHRRAVTDPELGRSRIERCLMSHCGDTVVLLGVVTVLVAHQRSAWALAVAMAACTMLLASLARVGALHTGVLLRRSPAERVARRGSVLLALLASALFQSDVPASGVPLIALAAAGSLLYAALEMAVVHVRLGEGTGVTVIQRRLHEPPVVLHHWGARCRSRLDDLRVVHHCAPGSR